MEINIKKYLTNICLCGIFTCVKEEAQLLTLRRVLAVNRVFMAKIRNQRF